MPVPAARRTRSPGASLVLSAWLVAALASTTACNTGAMRPVDFSTSAGTETGDGDGDSGDGDGDGDENSGDGDGDENSGDGDGDENSGGDPPTVVSTIPTAGSTAIDPLATVTVTFSEAMDPATISSNGGADTCSGSIQVSSDSFATCLPFSPGVASSDGDTAFTLTPFEPLESRRDYQIRVVAFASSAAGVELGTPYTSPTPFVSRYYHSVVIDGDKDFDASDEQLPTSSPGFTAYVAWDSDYVYLGMEGPDLASANPLLFWFAYLGGNPSTSTGLAYQDQTPTLPFGAAWHPRWKADDSYTNMQAYSGAWADAPGVWLEGPDWAHVGTYLELRLSRADLGNPTQLPMLMGLLREGPANNQATFAAVPDSAWTDGFDPAITSHFEFDLQGSVLPVEHSAL